MKRTLVLLVFAVLAVGIAGYGLPRTAFWRERLLRQHQQRTILADIGPLVLDATTKAILAGADRVETFRLAGGDFDEAVNNAPAGQKETATRPIATLDDYTVLRKGASHDKIVAADLNAALAQSKHLSMMTQCFDPIVGFRVWKGQAHTDLCVCFLCSGVEIVTENTRHKEVFHQRAELGESRPAFLALARQAFPQDKKIAALKD
jgi:hypothetical protein